MAIDSGSLIEPSVAKAGVDARHDVVLLAVGEKIREVETERCVSVVIAANKASIDEDDDVAEGAIELDPDTTALVAFRYVECAAIPTHAAFGITPAPAA